MPFQSRGKIQLSPALISVTNPLSDAPITFSLITGPAGMSVTSGGFVSWIPVAGQEGLNAVVIEAQNVSDTDTQNFSIDVAAAPVFPPTITSTPALTGVVGIAYVYDADSTVDASGTAPIRFSLLSGPAGMTVNSGGFVTWTPVAGQEGLNGVVIEAQNAFGSDTQNFLINVGVAPSFLLSDNFNDSNFDGWTIVDEGTANAPSAWSAATGTLIQSSNILSFPSGAAVLPKPGTYAQSDAGAAWSDYVFSSTIRSNDNDVLGVMFRMQDSSNYYRFSWDQQRPGRRLVKQVGGGFTLLVEDAVPYVSGQLYNLEITVDGSTIEVQIDGMLILSAVDGDLASDTIALYSWGNQGSESDNILVEPVG